MGHTTIVGTDLTKAEFSDWAAPGRPARLRSRKKLSRTGVPSLIGSPSRCVVAMEACANSHRWIVLKTGAHERCRAALAYFQRKGFVRVE